MAASSRKPRNTTQGTRPRQGQLGDSWRQLVSLAGLTELVQGGSPTTLAPPSAGQVQESSREGRSVSQRYAAGCSHNGVLSGWDRLSIVLRELSTLTLRAYETDATQNSRQGSVQGGLIEFPR